jgi:hypothetical protein
MRTCTVYLESLSEYAQSAYVSEPKLDRENPRDYEERTWRHRIHKTDTGEVFIPASAFKFALSRAAKMLSLQIPGKGKATYTKHFEAGVMFPESLMTGVQESEVVPKRLLLNSDGVRGGGKRVEKIIPHVVKWRGAISCVVLDETITKEIFEKHFAEAGLLVGVGQNRPENGGWCGRFKVVRVDWK